MVCPHLSTLTSLEAIVSSRRIEEFLLTKSIHKREDNQSDIPSDVAIRIVNGNFQWDDEVKDSFTLEDVNLEVKKGELVCIVGAVGSGKVVIEVAPLI